MTNKIINLESIIDKIRTLKFREDVGILFDSNKGTIYRFENEVALVIVKLLRDNRTLEQVKDYIIAEYAVDTKTVEEDLNEFLLSVNKQNEDIWEWDIEKKHESLLDFPLRLEIEVTSLCNWNCGFCYNVWKIDPNLSDRDVKQKIKAFPQKYLSKEKILKILDECSENGCFTVRYSGGETLLHPDIEEILEYGGKLGLYQVVFTNGHFLTPEYARRLKAYNVQTVLISLHGDETVHNFLAGHKKAYQKAIEAIGILSKADIEVVTELTLVKDNFDKALDVIKDAYSNGSKRFSVMRYVPTGKNDEKYGVPISNTLPLMNKIDNLMNELQDLVVGWPCGQRMCTSLNDIPIKNNDLTVRLRKKQLTGHCEAGLTWGSISFTGELRHCPHSNVYFGDVTSSSIKGNWKMLTNKVSKVLKPRETCNGCSLLDSCRGGCHLPYFFNTDLTNSISCN
ncbi:PqqD family peptide modification chaperone [Rummeliibacillus sp. SL167]|uniref:radical SAM protein n=1 Tax=Rummeliibacillus sp. SL167 TaxID=2579792 RepID=UPI0011B3C4F5|nr:PqqD family peptide modification chaperone [Rummeliibacillus sp. SL167]